ncbi:MAG TPA: hypothetical protein VJC21_02775 [Candidatus Nanoarchaeia archaeon]|nr:hypothetical protein [Candidatus Nanoarchaeia archaeon]
MNKHGAVFHWILFVGVVGGLGLFYLLIGTDPGVGIRGVWHTNFLWGLQEADKDMLLLDSAAREVLQETKDWINSAAYMPMDLGCGFFDENNPAERIPLLNREGRYCSLNIHEPFQQKYAELWQQRQPLAYEITLSGSDVVGKSPEKKAITSGAADEENEITFSQDNFIITPHRSGEPVAAAPPFYFRYEYNPGFRIPSGTGFSEFFQARQEAPAFVEQCRMETDLSTCILANLPSERWVPFVNCWPCLRAETSQPGEECFYPIAEKDRKVAFCYRGEGLRASVALDFR